MPQPDRKTCIPEFDLRRPGPEDGAAIWELVRDCKPLDENSMYCNLIQCDHFRDTCVLAGSRGEAVGWVSAYFLPDDPTTLFVWQVAVSAAARGTGLGVRMIEHLLGRAECRGIEQLQTTITSDNDASWGMFRKLARARGGALSHTAHFTRDGHFDGRHATEHMVTIDLPERLKKAA
ncbi:diaminobutyrate acetyltransferase [Sedimentitalea sp. JM2-8]|uniref:L-2,4-diaminobutyric acid acetyltransferase n=1 Tax=Sedimentitalea xiamensis TaxID=3050037 RepID=A0ABT7FHH7_9RHOB|nr:diaminobutyrate acetyltransferase [Sedimentitalea xiamensis]MDK3074590.1 diaminobutyrate acetyltransferase [Sedimentitalea xiamensis]